MGTWIETLSTDFFTHDIQMSFPSWERGLKPRSYLTTTMATVVVPLVGTWIETLTVHDLKNSPSRRSPRGNVD